MPEIGCPFPGCEYTTDDVDEALAITLLNIHALTHSQGASTAGSSKQKPPKIERPVLSRGTTEEEWSTFLKRWKLFKQGTDIPREQLTTQLWQCCEKDLEDDLFKDIDDVREISEEDLLSSIKRLAVISTATSVRKTELLSMRQDHGQPIRSFAAKVKGKAQVCDFSKQCGCTREVDYTDDIVKYVIISGIVDEEIKRDILGLPDLDDKSLNDTISLIENKEMAIRAMNVTSQSETTASISKTHHKQSKELDSKLSMKIPCQSCSKMIPRFKLRRGKPKEFTHCISCWKKLNQSQTNSESTTGAIFDVLGGISDNETDSSPGNRKPKKFAPVAHHIFDGTYGWIARESQKQPTVPLKMSTREEDYRSFNATFTKIKPFKLSVIADTGAQSSLMGLKLFKAAGFKQTSLLPVRKKMYAANNEAINILGAIPVRLTGVSQKGEQVETAEMVYVSDTTELFYLSRHAMEKLNIISSNFPSVGSIASLNVPSDSGKSSPVRPDVTKCECPTRVKPPPRPTELPFEPKVENIPKMKQWLLKRYENSTFNRCTHQPLPMMTGPPIKIHVNPDTTPTAVHTPASIPIHWRQQIKDQLDADVALGVIEKVEPNTPTTWCHRAIWVRKPDGSPRRCVDFQSLNNQCSRDTHHTVPPFQQARAIPQSTYRSVTDAWNGYHSVPVCEEDRHLLTFITEFGRYRYCVAPQGFKASGDGYTHRYDDIIADIPRKTKCVDDAVLWDETIEEHWWRMIDYLDLTGREGIVLNPHKFQFCQEEIEFAGFKITSTDIKPLPKYLDSIRQFPRPKNISDIRSWFGLVNQVSHYSKLNKIMEPFKPLLSPKTKFEWTDTLEQSFQNSKVELIKSIENGVRIFDPSRNTCLIPDWSRTGIGYWLRQKYCSCDSILPDCCDSGWIVTLAGSRFLKAAETRYAPIEGEALAIAWSLEDSKYFTMGCDKLTVTTDHEPLVKIFGDRLFDEIANPRIFKLKERALPWTFAIFHVPGKSIPASDATSRKPATQPTNDTNEWLQDVSIDCLGSLSETNFMEENIVASLRNSLNSTRAVTWDRVREETAKDNSLQQLKHYICNSFPSSINELPTDLHQYWQYRNELSVVDEVILVGGRILIPTPLRFEVCQILHSAHQGTTAMTERAKVSVFWPGITSCINRTRQNCSTCWRIAPSQPHMPPADPIVPSYPFQAVATDYCDFEGSHYLITVDRFSNWPEVVKVLNSSNNSGSAGLVKSLKRYFATFGVPEEVSSDGGPEFAAKETKGFFNRWGIKHRQSSAYYPKSNGRAEAAVKSMKRLLSNNIDSMGNLDTDSFTQAILQFRNTPDPANGISPAQILFGRQLRDTLPFIPRSQVYDNRYVLPVWKDLWAEREQTLRTRFAKQVDQLKPKSRSLPPLSVGDCCRIQNQNGRFPNKWDKTGKVVQVNDNNQYVIKVDGSGRLTLRNRKFLRKIQPLITTINPSHIYTDTKLSKPVLDKTDPQGHETLKPAVPIEIPDNQPSVELPEVRSTQDNKISTSSIPSSSSSSHQESQIAPAKEVSPPAVRRSTRNRKFPAWHSDYAMGK